MRKYRILPLLALLLALALTAGAQHNGFNGGGEPAAPALETRPAPGPQPEVIRSYSEWRERDHWQRPHEVMDELGLAPGARVADVGAGRGYFSFHLAERVGREGRVFAVDIDEREVQSLTQRAAKYKYPQIETVLGQPGDPHLPAGALDAVLVVNTYHEFREYEAMLRGMWQALRPGGLLAVIDRDAEPGQERSAYHGRHAIPESLVRQEAERHGFRLLRRPPGFTTDLGRQWYFMVFEKVEGTGETSAAPASPGHD